MTFSMIADIADLLAALGVIASLLFLAFEIRRTGRDTRQANWRAVLEGYVAFKALTNDRDFADFIIRGRSGYGALSAAEKLAFGQYQEQGIHIMTNFFKHAATMPEDVKGSIEAVEVVLYDHLDGPGAREWYADCKARGRLMTTTLARVDAVLDKGDAQRRG